ncbi:hypothetical protein [Mangrovimonas sp. TPBH4]|uniref:hypothetical protein n=1 Tax=Mangrovimonas sp. TPBH4 TaxID=1645914 RepID=UPI0006B5A134|nr:hypothetical protein [Mangrovimonas sp. TPBH4]
MKPFIYILFLLTLFCCVKENKRTDEVSSNIQKLVEPKKVDTIISTPQIQSVKNKEDWPKSLLTIMNEEIKNYGIYNIDKLVTLNDSLKIILFEFNDGVCAQTNLGTYLNENEIDFMEIGIQCDHDLSIPKYEWKVFEFIAQNKFKIKEFREYVHDSLIDSNGHIKDGYDFIESETKIDSIINHYVINLNGEISKQIK